MSLPARSRLLGARAAFACAVALSVGAACGGNVKVGGSSGGEGGDPCAKLEPIACACAGDAVEPVCVDAAWACPSCESCASNADCGDGRMCDFAANDCGVSGAPGTCRKLPPVCEGEEIPACGCDGTVHQSPCVATQSGVDLAVSGACAPPEGLFPCGALFCDPAQRYCEVTAGAAPGTLDFRCRLIPAACLPDTACDCLADEACGASCQPSGGGFVLSCVGSG